jgi:bacterial/archaeal transporter family-2 protein
MLPLQFAVNSQLARHLGNPIAANVFSFGVGFCVLFALSLLFVRGLPPLSTLGHLPLYVIVGGGLLGATILTTSIFLIPILGTAAVLCLVMAGQLIGALLIDQFGILGLAAREVTVGRAVGAVVVLVGALMVRLL